MLMREVTRRHHDGGHECNIRRALKFKQIKRVQLSRHDGQLCERVRLGAEGFRCDNSWRASWRELLRPQAVGLRAAWFGKSTRYPEWYRLVPSRCFLCLLFETQKTITILIIIADSICSLDWFMAVYDCIKGSVVWCQPLVLY